MELFEFNSDIHKVNKLVECVRKEYDITLSESNIDDIITKNARKIQFMIENVQDNASNAAWAKAKLVHDTATMVKRLLEFGPQYRVDPKTGAILNYQKADGKKDSSIAARPDLYWREQDADTADSVVIPMPLSDEELAKAAKKLGTTVPETQPSGGTGMYVGVDTPGAQHTVINNKDGANKVVKAKMSKSGVVKSTTADQKRQQKADGAEFTDSPFTNMRGKKSDKYKTKVKSTIAGSKERMNEEMSKNHILMLAESEIEKAQIVMAVNNEIVEKLQRDAEKMSNMKIDVLGPIVERIKAEHGLEPAENFRDTITRLIDQALDTVMQVKDQIHTETLKLTGDISSAPSLEQDLGADAGMGDLMGGADLGMEDPLAGETFEMEDEFTTDEPELEPVPAEREMKESRKLGVVLESTQGKVGKKYFSQVSEMRTWLAENKDKIAKVHKVLKD